MSSAVWSAGWLSTNPPPRAFLNVRDIEAMLAWYCDDVVYFCTCALLTVET